jgi:HlyD family secretion protein
MNKKKLVSISWKISLVLLIALVVVYRLYFTPVPVEHFAVKTGPITEEVMGTGTLEPRVQATISAKISGRVSQVLADQGDRVAKGQVLAVLDDGDLRQQVEVARADEAATKAGVERAAAEVVSAEATALHARSVFARMSSLAKQEVISTQELDDATQQHDVAEAQLSRAQLAKVELERQVIKAEASLQYSQEKLADTQISAPFDGLVIRRDRDPGAIVVPGSSILQVISTEEMWVAAWIDEASMPNLTVGQGSRVVFRSEPGKSYKGTLTRISPLADRETREFLADVLVKELPKTWAVGQRAEVYVQTASKENALVVPQKAIVWQKGKPGLFVSNGGHASWKSVELGLRGADMAEIRSGVAEGETTIWPAGAKDAALTDGRAVRLQ